MVTKYADIDASVAEIVKASSIPPEAELDEETRAYYAAQARAAPIIGEAMRFLMTEANSGYPSDQTIGALVATFATVLFNVSRGAVKDKDDPEDDPQHAMIHQFVDQLGDDLHRALAIDRGALADEYHQHGGQVTLKRKDVGDA